jgi:2-methylcitrate dehydratase PrpD
MSANDLAAQFIAEITWDRLPAPVRGKAHMCLVDTLGAALAGTLAPISRISAEYALDAWPGDEATLLYQGKRSSALGAAFANACAANALDVDDSARYAYGHAGVQIFATALAVAQSRRLTGAQMLTGMVVGYEIAHRVGRCWHASRPVYQACGSWGSVACAAVAAHLMGLPVEQVRHALGIAEYHAPNLPMMRDVDHPSMVKHGAEWAALTGIISAELAAAGFTGIPGILSFPEYQEGCEDIGQNYLMVEGVAWKAARFACCGWAHAGVEGAHRLVLENSIALTDIARIRVDGSHGTYRLGTRLPETTEEAQFNQAWPLAAMLVDGEIGPRQMLEERLSDPHIRALAQKVEVHESEEMERLCRLFEQGDPHGRFASRVTISLNDGQMLESGLVDGGLRFPPQGWDQARMSEKFRWLAGFVLDASQVEEILEMLWQFEDISSVAMLNNRLKGPGEER